MTHGRDDEPSSPTTPARRGEGSCCGGGRPGSSGGCGSHAAHDHAHDHAGHGGGCCGGGTGHAPGAAETEEVLVFTRDRIRALDTAAVEKYAIPSILLMENAARGVAGVIIEGLAGIGAPTALVFCGPGNNGGDGFAIARHLHNRGVSAAIILATDRSRVSGDALTNLNIADRMGLPVFDAHLDPGAAVGNAIGAVGDPVVVVDALLGTGAEKPAAGPIGALINQINDLKRRGSTVVAVDLPSGMNADTGEPCADATATGPCVEADLTVTLAGIKSGFLKLGAQKHVGELAVVDIGAPVELMRELGRPLHQHTPGA